MKRGNTTLAALALGGAVILLLIFMYISARIGYIRKAVDLETTASAKQDVNKTVFDTCWKIIEGQAGVASQYKEDFKDVYATVMNGEGRKGGELFKFIREHNPEFDSSLYKTVSASIESQRMKLQTAQASLRDIKREHDKLRNDPVNSFLFGQRPEIKVVLVTSETTEKAFETGRDEESPNPFKKR